MKKQYFLRMSLNTNLFSDLRKYKLNVGVKLEYSLVDPGNFYLKKGQARIL